ncbi:cytochrome P450 4A24-like [Liolophura sinensis]|uniref:cytochrome P450 4A24-like n=1 Tax=Liolophura sinensis TaxID=3198878 RepID=UPI0031594281
MATIGLLLISAVVLWLSWLFLRHRGTIQTILTTRRAAKQFPSIPPHWLYGNFNQAKDCAGFFKLFHQLTQKYNRKFVFWSSSLRPVITVVHPETVKNILKSTEPKTTALGAGYKLIEDWIGDGLLLSSGKKWERNRKLLTPAFHFATLKPYINEYNKALDAFLNKIEKESESGDFIEVTGPIGLLTLDVMLRCAFSYEGHIQEQGSTHPYVVAIHNLSDLVFKRAVNPILYIKLLYDITPNGREWKKTCDFVHKFSGDIIAARKKILESDPDILKSRHLDFLDILLTAKDENGEGLSDIEIRDEVDTFLFEGHDTTASSASWITYALAKFPNIQEQVYQEVKDVLGSRTSIEWDDITKLTYTKLVIKEAMRMYSPVYQISRQTTKQMEIDGCHVPVGMSIDINIMNINHNPTVWSDHEVFDPMRFAGDDFSERNPYKYIPFSAGPRNCIGQNFAMNELLSFVARTVQRFKLELDEDHEIIFMPCVVMRAETGIRVKFGSRK